MWHQPSICKSASVLRLEKQKQKNKSKEIPKFPREGRRESPKMLGRKKGSAPALLGKLGGAWDTAGIAHAAALHCSSPPDYKAASSYSSLTQVLVSKFRLAQLLIHGCSWTVFHDRYVLTNFKEQQSVSALLSEAWAFQCSLPNAVFCASLQRPRGFINRIY